MHGLLWYWQRCSDLWRASPVGGAPLLLLLGLLLSGAFLLAVPARRDQGTVVYWTFAGGHRAAYEAAAPSWEARHPGERVTVQLVHGNAITERLRSAFWTGGAVPDLVEVEITPAATFFRGPIDQVGFVDLAPLIDRDGLRERIPASRLAPYTDRGRIFGLPHDVHPVMLAYRADLLEPLLAERGLSSADIATWDAFWAFGAAITIRGERYLLQLDDSAASSLEVLMVQRGANFFAADGRLTMDDELVLDTLCRLVPLVAGDHPGRCAINTGWGDSFYRGLDEGYTLAVVCPDWRTRTIQDNLPGRAGVMKLMPLPAWHEGGPRTSTWGGTMLGLPRGGGDVELRWDLAKHVYFSADEAGTRFLATNILPPDRAAWRDPAFHQTRPYWSDQDLGGAYIALADQVPITYGSPFLNLAKAKLGEVVAASVAHWAGIAGQVDAAARLRTFAAVRLARAAGEVRRQMAREPEWP